MSVWVELESRDGVNFTVKVSATLPNPYGPDIHVELASEAEKNRL